MMLRKLVSLLGENVMEIHTSLKSISDREMRVILKSQILTTVEEKEVSNLEVLIEASFFMHDIKPETIKGSVAYKNISFCEEQ